MAEDGSERREDLAELLRRRALTEDAARPEAVERRHAGGGRTARENVQDLVDPGSFVEYGRFAIAAQRGRRELRELIERTLADGPVAGTARVNGELRAAVRDRRRDRSGRDSRPDRRDARRRGPARRVARAPVRGHLVS